MARRGAGAIPIFTDVIIKNPNEKTLFPINWEEGLDESRYWYEDEPVFDSEGNCTMKRNLYIVQKKLTGFYYRKKRKSNYSGQKPLIELKGDDEADENKPN